MKNKRAKLLYLLFAGVVVWAGVSLALHFSKPALPPALPADFARLNVQLQVHLATLIGNVKRFPRDADTHATLALAYAANSLWEPARREYGSVIRLNPKEPLAHLYSGVAALELGDAEAALTVFRLTVQKFPTCAPAWQRLGDLALRRGLLEEAERAYGQLTQLAPNEWRGFAGLGQVRLKEGKAAEAQPLFEHAISLDPQARKAHFLLGTVLQTGGNTNIAQVELCLGANAQESPMADSWSVQAPLHMKNMADQVEMAREMREHGEEERAAGLLLSALKFQPTNTTLLNNLAITHNQMSRPDLALPLLQDAIRENPRDVSFKVSLSYTQQLLGEPAKALETAEQIIAEAPNLPQAYLAKANALLALEKDKEAIETLRKASEVDPQNEGILIEIGGILWKNFEQPDAAIEAYRKALEIKPCSPRAYFSMAELLDHLGNKEEAQKYLRTARRLAQAEGWVQGPSQPNSQ